MMPAWECLPLSLVPGATTPAVTTASSAASGAARSALLLCGAI